jgi:MFS family permease
LKKNRRSPLRQIAVVIACLSALLGSLDSAINIGFPAITAAFSVEVTAIQWVIVGYVLTHASLLIACGSLADRWGHGRMLAHGLWVSAVGFTCCGIAPAFIWLVAGRIIQGAGAALVFATAPALVTLAVSAKSRGRVLGIFQMCNAVGYAIGPLLGGMLIDILGWRATFLFRVAPALLLAGLAAVKLPMPEQPRERQRGMPRSPLRIAHLPPFVIANLLSVLANCTRFAIGLLLPYYVINVLRYPATTGGTLMLATYLLTILAAPLAGKLSDRFGTARLSSLGLAVQATGLWLLSGMDGQTTYLSLALALGVVGLGLGIFESPNMSFIMGSIPRSQQGVAGSIASMMRPLGIVLGATGWSLLFDWRRHAYMTPTFEPAALAGKGMLPALQDVFLSAAALCFAAFILSLLRRTERARFDTD